MPAGEAGTYTMLRVDGRDVAGLYGRGDQQGPPAWLSYVSVDEIEATVRRAEELGATVLSAPFEVIQSGRIAVLADPQGAVFALWQPGAHFGAALVNVPGALTMNQLNTSDPEGAQRFYESLFGWRFEHLDTGGGPPYASVFNGETLNAGMMPLPEGAQAPPHWLVYFACQSLEEAQTRLTDGGGEVVVPATGVPAGRFLVARDPQGAYFALFDGELDP